MNRGLLLNSSFAVPRSIAGCVAAIGEVARSDGGVKCRQRGLQILNIPSTPVPKNERKRTARQTTNDARTSVKSRNIGT